MREYWLYLETYVFLWSNRREIIVYNTLSGKGYVYPDASELKSIVAQLEDKSNLYCISINEEDMKCPVVCDFIFSIRANFCGDLLDKSIFKQKPVVIIPELCVNEEAFISAKTFKRDIVSGINAVKNLLELTIYITDDCPLNCKDCDQTYKQIAWCRKTKGKNILAKEAFFDILTQCRNTSLSEIKIIGGNVFSYPFWDEIIDELKMYSCNKSFYIDHRLLPAKPEQLEIFEQNEGFSLCVLIDTSSINEQGNEKIPINQKYNYYFKIKSIAEYELAQSIIEQQQIESKIIPFYDGTNLQFFEDNIFQNLDDILNTHWSKSDIFAHTVLNTNDFGNFTILTNGKIFANVNFEPIGDIKSDDIKLLENQELIHGKSWLLNRNKIFPCKDCLYKYLCPSPSNYEIVIGRNNLCHLKIKNNDV